MKITGVNVDQYWQFFVGYKEICERNNFSEKSFSGEFCNILNPNF